MSRARALIQAGARYWTAVPISLVLLLLGVRACLHEDPIERLQPANTEAADPPGTRAYSGSLAVTRGGPVVVGFTSDELAQVTIAGHELRGTGLVKQRIVLPRGPAAIRVAMPRGARLVWSPVGRRGDPEYVPASSLSPSPPETATFTRPGTAITDGVIALGLLLVAIGTVLALARHRLARVPRATWSAMIAVFAVAAIVRWLGLDDFGVTWDEDVNWASGRNYVTNLLSLDFSERAWAWNYEHPPVMKLLAGVGAQLADGYGPARALAAAWVALGCALLVPIGKRLFGLRVGVLAGVIAALLPPLVAHGQIVGHEAPTVLWWSLGILLALCAHDDLPDDDTAVRTLRWRLAAVGAVVGIAVASRFVNGLLGPVCVVIVLVGAPARWRRATQIGLPLMIAACVVVFYAVWPRLWSDPIAALSASLAKLSKPHAPEPFLGVLTNDPPAHYFVAYLAATLPVGILVGAAVGLVRVVVARTRTTWIVLAWLVVPLAIVASPVRQDGVRYVMPCLTALALLAAAGLDVVAIHVLRRVPRAFPALAAVVVAYLAVTLVRVHPYYLDYYGEHVGGAGGVAARRWFETGWWGEGLDRAVSYVNAHAAPNARVFRDCIEPVHLAWFREDLWDDLTPDPRHAAWIVVYGAKLGVCRLPPDARKVYEVTAQGAVLAAVYQRPAP